MNVRVDGVRVLMSCGVKKPLPQTSEVPTLRKNGEGWGTPGRGRTSSRRPGPLAAKTRTQEVKIPPLRLRSGQGSVAKNATRMGHPPIAPILIRCIVFYVSGRFGRLRFLQQMPGFAVSLVECAGSLGFCSGAEAGM